MSAHTGPILEGIGATDYERYVRVPELLSLQKDRSQLVHPEESLFQITHQAAELWLKQIDREMSRVAECLKGRDLDQSADLLNRCTLIITLLRDQIVILETMAPADYHVIRVASLGRGSGGESPGFAKLLDVGQRLWPVYSEILSERGLSPLDIEREHQKHFALHRLQQAMMEYDSSFMKWRFTHMKLAMRIIGSRVMSLKGVPVTQLEFGSKEPLFPVLWDAISDLTAEFKPQY